jgi:hypothetical protein
MPRMRESRIAHPTLLGLPPPDANQLRRRGVGMLLSPNRERPLRHIGTIAIDGIRLW